MSEALVQSGSAKRRSELARRMVFVYDALGGGTYIRSPVEINRDKEPGTDVGVPVLHRFVKQWNTRIDLRGAGAPVEIADDAVIVCVPGRIKVPAELPPGCRIEHPDVGCLTGEFLEKLRTLLAEQGEHAMQAELAKASGFGDFDVWIPPAALAAGQLSYAHTTTHYADTFTHSNDPLSGHTDWAVVAGRDDELYSDGSVCSSRDTSGVTKLCEYDGPDMTAVSADYSVEADVVSTGVANKLAMMGVRGRATDITHCYFLRLKKSTPASLDLYERNGATNLRATDNDGIPSTALIRLEMVTSGGNCILKGYLDGMEILNHTDETPLAGPGSAGIYASVDTDAADYGSIDNFKVYVTRVARPRVDGTLAHGRTGLVR